MTEYANSCSSVRDIQPINLVFDEIPSFNLGLTQDEDVNVCSTSMEELRSKQHSDPVKTVKIMKQKVFLGVACILGEKLSPSIFPVESPNHLCEGEQNEDSLSEPIVDKNVPSNLRVHSVLIMALKNIQSQKVHYSADGKLEMNLEEFKEWLKKFDVDKDGKISKEELQEVVRSTGGRFCRIKGWRGMKFADTNKSGFIDENELNNLVEFAQKYLHVRIVY
ncbi:putative calcium-binding protein 1-like [Capsicum annuum]|nr:putative calcium-binding protein 1-like [Capsicum annuum]